MNPVKTTCAEQIIDDVKEALSLDPSSTFAIIGHTPVAYEVLSFFRAAGAASRLVGLYSDQASPSARDAKHFPIDQLAVDAPDTVIVAADAEKERLLLMAAPHLRPDVRVVIGGYGHFEFRDEIFDEVVQTALVPSLANGYPNTLVHLYQCLRNAARLDLRGVVAEFGMFKGGTTMLLSRFTERLGRSWPVIGFDTFDGFPPKRSVLDMYAHPGCIFRDEELVRRLTEGRNIEVVPGDVVLTSQRLAREDVVLAFVDTDNYTSASAILDVVQDRIVVGGAIVFDHFTGRDRFRYTLGERIAATRLLADHRYFNLHDTGVFLRQR